jgi:predicted negative regulator of RcsB-dependent stress response
LDGLASAELLLLAGTLSGWVASSNHTAGGRKPAEALLNGSIAIFEQLGEKAKAAEGRIELACCYYHQGVFDLARVTLHSALKDLSSDDRELRSVALIRLAVVERFPDGYMMPLPSWKKQGPCSSGRMTGQKVDFT